MARVLRIQFQALLWLALLSPLAVQASSQTQVLLSSDSGSYRAVSDALARHLSSPPQTLTVKQAETTRLTRTIAVGSNACQYAQAHADGQTILLCTFLPSQTFFSLARGTAAKKMLREGRLSAVFIDQPLARQIRLARLIKPDAKTIGTVVGASSQEQAEAFSATARAQKLQPLIARLHDNDNPVQVLTPIIEQSDLFLPLPDRSIFNRAAAKWILYITLRDGVPLIGFSSKYADAGACVAIYSSIDQVARQSAEIMSSGKTVALPPPSYPRDFSITVNQTALRNLGLPALHSDDLKQRLRQEEGQ